MSTNFEACPYSTSHGLFMDDFLENDVCIVSVTSEVDLACKDIAIIIICFEVTIMSRE